jgi:hypothetical protein
MSITVLLNLLFPSVSLCLAHFLPLLSPYIVFLLPLLSPYIAFLLPLLSSHLVLPLPRLTFPLPALPLYPAIAQTSLTSPNSPPKSATTSSDDEVGPVYPVVHPDPTQAMPTSSKARAKCRIAALEDELIMMWEERGGKQR